MSNRPAVVVDLDGVLADYSEGWKGPLEIGPPIPGAAVFTRILSLFADIVIFTTRVTPIFDAEINQWARITAVKEWLDKNSISYNRIEVSGGKPPANAYIDDRAIVCDPTSLHWAKPVNKEETAKVVYISTIFSAMKLCNLSPEDRDLVSNSLPIFRSQKHVVKCPEEDPCSEGHPPPPDSRECVPHLNFEER